MGVSATEVAAAVTREEADRAWTKWPRVRVTGGREALQKLLAADGRWPPTGGMPWRWVVREVQLRDRDPHGQILDIVKVSLSKP